MLSALAFAGIAGVLSILSPCTLPLVPIVLATAAGAHRRGPLALAAGLALSFTVVGMFVALVGFSIGLDAGLFRSVGGALLLAAGVVLLSPALQGRVAALAGPASNAIEGRFGRPEGEGWVGQFGVGLLLGLVWSPCVGPTLGAASLMASRGENLPQVALTMLAFGLGAAAPLLALGALSREALLRWRGRMLAAGSWGKRAMGAGLALVGLLVLSGADKTLEVAFLRAAPAWLVDAATRF